MDYRESYRNQFINVIEHWVEKHAESTYAGYDFNDEEGIIYLGFTVDPEGTLEEFKHDIHLIAPDRIQPFPVSPIYTLRELIHLWATFWKGRLLRLVNISSIDVLANKVKVGTEHVVKVRQILAERYGPHAPFEVVFSRPVVPS